MPKQPKGVTMAEETCAICGVAISLPSHPELAAAMNLHLLTHSETAKKIKRAEATIKKARQAIAEIKHDMFERFGYRIK